MYDNIGHKNMGLIFLRSFRQMVEEMRSDQIRVAHNK